MTITEAPALPKDFTIVELIDSLGGPTAFAKICGFDTHAHARGGDMRRRQSVSLKYWDKVIAAAHRAGFGHVTYETIARAARRRKRK